MAFYIKVTREVADKLGVAGIRNSTADGNVLLWQADVAGFPGDTVFDRAAVVGRVPFPAAGQGLDRRRGRSGGGRHSGGFHG